MLVPNLCIIDAIACLMSSKRYGRDDFVPMSNCIAKIDDCCLRKAARKTFRLAAWIASFHDETAQA
jgi:hypothetical protein